MKRLDDILLEDIKSFEFLDKTLIIYTKDEILKYTYPNNLELLRKISYFIHRYRIECEDKINKNAKQLEEESIDIKNNISNKINIFSDNLFKATMTLLIIGFIFGINTAFLYLYFGFGIYNFAKLIMEIKQDKSKFSVTKIFETSGFIEFQNMQIAFDELKNKSLFFIESLDEQLLTHIKIKPQPERNFIENMKGTNVLDFLETIPYAYEEKEFQKSLGDYPYLRK